MIALLFAALIAVGTEAWPFVVGNVQIDPEGFPGGKITDEDAYHLLFAYGEFDAALRFLDARPGLSSPERLKQLKFEGDRFRALVRKYKLPLNSLPAVENAVHEIPNEGRVEFLVYCYREGNVLRNHDVYGWPARGRLRAYKEGSDGILTQVGDELEVASFCPPRELELSPLPNGILVGVRVPSHRTDCRHFFSFRAGRLFRAELVEGNKRRHFDGHLGNPGYGDEFQFKAGGQRLTLWEAVKGSEDRRQAEFSWSGEAYVLERERRVPRGAP